MSSRLLMVMSILILAAVLSGCIVPPERPLPPPPGQRIAARKIPPPGASQKDKWLVEIKKMGAEPLTIDRAWFDAFPDRKMPYELADNLIYREKMNDIWAKGLNWRYLLDAKWAKELTAFLETQSLEWMNEDREGLKKWREDQSPPWPGPVKPQ